LLGQAVSFFGVHLARQKHLSAILGDEMLTRLGDEMLALLGDEMLAPDRDSARSNRVVARPTHNNDRRESPSKSKGVVSLNRENKGCPALKK
jgi:hypothetical protein